MTDNVCYHIFRNALDYFAPFRIIAPFSDAQKTIFEQSNAVL